MQQKALGLGCRARYYGGMNQDRITQLEETVAHLTLLVDELNEVVTKQDTELSRLSHLVRILTEREAEREQGNSGGVVLGDERPPHY